VPTLHVNIDEAGCWNFHRKGSKFFILTVAWTYDPAPLARALTDLRFALVKKGIDIDSFHAAEDKQATRDAVVNTLLAVSGWNFAAVVMEKRLINPALYEPHRFYPKFAGSLLRFVLRGRMRAGTDNVLVYADTIPMTSSAKRQGVVKAMKTTCAELLPSSCASHIFSHPRQSNSWLQVVDYCCWGVQRKWQLKDERTYQQLLPKLAAPELNITAGGDGTAYY
jgi:Protein of unknown function (DUF3800)